MSKRSLYIWSIWSTERPSRTALAIASAAGRHAAHARFSCTHCATGTGSSAHGARSSVTNRENSCFSRGVNPWVSMPGSPPPRTRAPPAAPVGRKGRSWMLRARPRRGGLGRAIIGGARRDRRDAELRGDALLERLVVLDVELAAVDEDRGGALQVDVFAELVGLGDGVGHSRCVEVGFPPRDVELEHLGVTLEIRVFEVLLPLEE